MIVKFVTVLLGLLVPLAVSEDINITNVTFCQLAFLSPDGNAVLTDGEYTGWFDLSLEFIGSSDVFYLNVAANGEWPIQNVPVLSRGGNETGQEAIYTFGIENVGQVLNEFDFGIELTDEILVAPPNETETASIKQQQVRIGPGGGVEQPPPEPWRLPQCAAKPLKGGMKADGAMKHVNAPYKNVDCATNYCVPAAISNSLNFLNDKHDLKLDKNEISVGALGQLLGTTTKGGTAYKEWTKKRDKFKDKVHTYTIPATPENELVPYPVTAASLARPFPENEVDKICDLLDRDCAVEMFTLTPTGGFGHAVAIVGIIKLKNGRYSIDVAHDVEQNQGGGTKTETVTWDTTTNRIEGGKSLNCKAVWFLVVECPKKNGGGGMGRFDSICMCSTLLIRQSHS